MAWLESAVAGLLILVALIFGSSGATQPAEPPATSVASSTILGRVQLQGGYTKDTQHVYLTVGYGTDIVAGADPATFIVLDSGPWGAHAKDASHVYHFDSAIAVDPKTVISLNNGEWLKDERHVYDAEGTILPATSATFVVVTNSSASDTPAYAKDASHVYIGNLIVQGADPATFQILPGGNYAEDNSGVWFLGGMGIQKIKDADVGSFTVTGPDSAFDRFHNYGEDAKGYLTVDGKSTNPYYRSYY